MFNVALSPGQNAPITTIGNLTTTSNTVIVPVTVQNFTNIAACNLKINFNSTIATLTNVTVGPSVPSSGGMSFNNTVPGEVTIGWYGNPFSTMQNGNVFLNLYFTKVNFGTTPIVFTDDNNSYACLYYNNNFDILNDTPTNAYYINGSLTFNPINPAPVTSIPHKETCPGQNVSYPVSVTGFNNIGAASFIIRYDPQVLSNPLFSNTSGTLSLSANTSIPGTISVSGQSQIPGGVSLPNNTVFFTLKFTYNGGFSDIYFDHSLLTNCTYSGPQPFFNSLYDLPKSNYYINGSVNQSQSYEFTTNTSICEGSNYFWRGGNYSTNGTYVHAYQTQNGCDSLYVLNLSVNPVYFTEVNTEIYSYQLPYSWEGLQISNEGTYYQNLFTANGCDSILQLNLSVINVQFKTLTLHVFLQGLYNTNGTMNQAHNENGPEYYTGIADKITVELHDALNTATVHYQNTNVMLHTDGTAILNDILSNLTDEYYIVIRHRNSIETWSKLPVSFSGSGAVEYDFTNAATQAYGNNMSLVQGGKYALYCGDINGDNTIDGSDLSAIDNALTLIMEGYISEDVNGDGKIDASDVAFIDDNATLLIHTLKP